MRFPSFRSSSPRSHPRTFSHINTATSSPPVLYCATCHETLTSSCLISGTHREHRLQELHQAVDHRMVKIKKISEELKSDMRKLQDFHPRIENAESKLEALCDNTQKLLEQQYESLLDLIHQNQKQAFLLLNSQRETMRQKLQQLYEDSQNYQQQSTNLLRSIEELSNNQTEDTASLLGEISALETRLDTMLEFYSSVDEKLKLDTTRLKALEISVLKVVEKNKDLLPRPWEFLEQITLDHNKKQGKAQISEDGTEMWQSARYGPPYGANSTAWSSVLASQSFNKGLHYWEVSVGDSKNWLVGVVDHNLKGSVGSLESLGRNKSSWVLECEDDEISAVHNDSFSEVKDNDVHTLGVFVDCDKKRVKFYNVSTGLIMHSFNAQFKHSVWPVFSIRSQDGTTARLKICNLVTGDTGPDDADAVSITSQDSHTSN
ncbi:E3 ubiquitin-protein ligase TRIM39-like [Trichomycterus rosablanca]|uniref:E3 ubiquitin-protein ligase TRIM39-like n=1 Tax=Trichomycterus rosablanca TaxID=2290929 RepID=UPI002F35FF14